MNKVLLSLCVVAAAPALRAQASASAPCPAQTGGDANKPFPVCDVKSVITRGPYLSAPTDTSATITFMTDMPAHVKVVFNEAGKPQREAVSAKDGMLAVGTLHNVRLTGLLPGRTYHYKLVISPVIELLSYWPKKGLETESATFTFKTMNRAASTANFAVFSDLHESVGRIDTVAKLVDWNSADFVVNTGDSFNGVTSEKQLWDRWLTPLINAGMQRVPLIFARGNHDTRGGFARELTKYLPIEEGRFYFTRDQGPLHLLVIDTGEDKADSTQVYSRLNVMESYRKEEFVWLKNHIASSARLKSASFRVMVMHQPEWGWLSGDQKKAEAEWTAAANAAKVDLVIAGHNHTYSLTPAGSPRGNSYPILVVGQGDVASVQVTPTEMTVVVKAKDGTVKNSFTILRKK